MKRILQQLGLAGLTVLTGCKNPIESTSQEKTVINYEVLAGRESPVELTFQEKTVHNYERRFNAAYELARQSYQTYIRNSGRTDAIDRAVSEGSLRAYKDYLKEMDLCIQALRELKIDVSRLEKQVLTLSNK